MLGNVISIEYLVVVFVRCSQSEKLLVLRREHYLLAVTYIYNVECILSVHKLTLIVRRDSSWREASHVDYLGTAVAEDVGCRERMVRVPGLFHPVGVGAVRCPHACGVIELYWLHRL